MRQRACAETGRTTCTVPLCSRAAMYLAGPPSRDFEPHAIVAPERFGAVAWSDFNRSYARLQVTPWRLINRGRPYGALRRGLRLLIAYLTERNDAFVDLATKAEALAG